MHLLALRGRAGGGGGREQFQGPSNRDEMSVKASHRLSVQDWLPRGRWEREGWQRGTESTGSRKKLGWHLPGRSRSDENDNGSMESVCKERSFPGRLENQYFNTIPYSVFLTAAPESPSASISTVQTPPHSFQGFALPLLKASCPFVLSTKALMSKQGKSQGLADSTLPS